VYVNDKSFISNIGNKSKQQINITHAHFYSFLIAS